MCPFRVPNTNLHCLLMFSLILEIPWTFLSRVSCIHGHASSDPMKSTVIFSDESKPIRMLTTITNLNPIPSKIRSNQSTKINFNPCAYKTTPFSLTSSIRFLLWIGSSNPQRSVIYPGLICVAIGLGVAFMDIRYPEKIADFFGVDPLQDYEEHYYSESGRGVGFW